MLMMDAGVYNGRDGQDDEEATDISLRLVIYLPANPYTRDVPYLGKTSKRVPNQLFREDAQIVSFTCKEDSSSHNY